MSDIYRANVLVVDDELANLELLMSVLDTMEIRTQAASDGFKALEAVKKEIPDLMIIDVKMPQMNGFQLAQHLQNAPETQNIPIMFISALHDDKTMNEGFKHQALDYLTKPFNIQSLYDSIDEALKLRDL